MKAIGDGAGENNFDRLRLVAASTVVIAHAYVLDGRSDPYSQLTGVSLGWSAVVMFFAISGFLVAQSLERRTLSFFIAARALRIFPGLAVCVLLMAVTLAPLSSLPSAQYFASPQTHKFVFGNATLLVTEYWLPGVFSDRPSTQANGSLWTLRYEIACYMLLALTYLTTRSRPAWRNAVVVLVLAAGISARALALLTSHQVPIQALNLIDLLLPFLVGSWVFWNHRRVTAAHVLAGLLACIVLSHTPFLTLAATLTIAMLTLWIALTPFSATAVATSRPDYSYGIYIYAYPIQQVISEGLPALHPLMKAVVALLVVLVPASLSWHFVERPSLSLKKVFGSGSTNRRPAGSSDQVA